MPETKMSAKAEEALLKMQKTWVGKQVKIVGLTHPHKGGIGVATSIDYTNAGWGIKVEFEDGLSGYVFKGTDIRLID
mgnify:CR=1 FL=1